MGPTIPSWCSKGDADLRQGDTRHPISAGTCAFVPAGQIHGTITTANDTIMISFQTPPDLVLYTGARDSSRPGAAAPKGVITPGAVKYIPFAKVNGFFAYPGATGTRVAAARHELKAGPEVHHRDRQEWRAAAVRLVRRDYSSRRRPGLHSRRKGHRFHYRPKRGHGARRLRASDRRNRSAGAAVQRLVTRAYALVS